MILRTHLTFLRAINVGGHTVKMDVLRSLFEELGYAHVSTFIASGNVIFESDAAPGDLETQIEAHLEQELGYEVATFIRSPAELAATVRYASGIPGYDPEADSLHIAFLKQVPAESAWSKLLEKQTSMDTFYLEGREYYWHCRGKVSDSKFSNAVLERLLKQPATMRNITTVQKLSAKYPA
ncbi:MAG TPA: DUF1697 domain-containing protein [Aggregatilineales bacterium]|nr:DUF1697 domain-containing protein [Aggregatilineales bacterium]